MDMREKQISTSVMGNESQHDPNQEETSPRKEVNDTSSTLTARSVPVFDRSSVIVEELLSWRRGSGGGCKSDRQAQQIVSKCLKFLKLCCEDEEELYLHIIDFSLGSPNLLFKFALLIQCRTNARGHAGRIGYLDTGAALMDFRNENGASEVVLRGLPSTETYLKKSLKSLKNDATAMDK